MASDEWQLATAVLSTEYVSGAARLTGEAFVNEANNGSQGVTSEQLVAYAHINLPLRVQEHLSFVSLASNRATPAAVEVAGLVTVEDLAHYEQEDRLYAAVDPCNRWAPWDAMQAECFDLFYRLLRANRLDARLTSASSPDEEQPPPPQQQQQQQQQQHEDGDGGEQRWYEQSVAPHTHAYIANLGVDERFRRRHIGTDLVRCAVERLRSKGYAYVSALLTSPHSQRICRNEGFRVLRTFSLLEWQFEGRAPFASAAHSISSFHFSVLKL